MMTLDQVKLKSMSKIEKLPSWKEPHYCNDGLCNFFSQSCEVNG
ncbi:hypothetical protein [Paenibacillus sp. FSL R7-269]|nr:hypothetical protein [Paenibacillus sp. FSL R7-269]